LQFDQAAITGRVTSSILLITVTGHPLITLFANTLRDDTPMPFPSVGNLIFLNIPSYLAESQRYPRPCSTGSGAVASEYDRRTPSRCRRAGTAGTAPGAGAQQAEGIEDGNRPVA